MSPRSTFQLMGGRGKLRVFTMSQLRRYDGRDGRRAYVAVNGIVYDVTTSFLWQRGNHQVFHDAGGDLTSGLEQAPHDAAVLSRFPRVGLVADEAIM